MPAYTNIPNGLVAVGAKPFATTMQALRDNPTAIAEGDSAAPVNAYGWHPYNKVTVGDTNTGSIWSFSVDGAVATITTPDFVNGWEYAFLGEQVALGSTVEFRVNIFAETLGAYTGAQAAFTFPALSGVVTSFFMEIPSTRKLRRGHNVIGQATRTAGSGAPAQNAQGINVGSSYAAANRILRAQFTVSSGTIGGSAGSIIYMYRRRDVGE